MHTAATCNGESSADLAAALNKVAPTVALRYTVFTFDKVARDFANDLTTAIKLAQFHRGYVRDSDGNRYSAR